MAMMHLVNRLPELKILDLNLGDLVDDTFLRHLARNGQNLRVLFLNRRFRFTGEPINAVSWANLKMFDMSDYC